MRNKKKLLGCLAAALLLFFDVSSYADAGVDIQQILEPQSDIDLVVLQNNQSKTVTADLSFPMDFGVIPVTLIGYGRFNIVLTGPDSRGDLIYMYSFVVKGFGTPSNELKFGLTPFRSLNTMITISDDEEFNWAEVIILHGILFSLEDPPYEYKLNLSF